MDLSNIRSAVQQGRMLVTAHAVLEALAEGLKIADIWGSLLGPDAEIIEDYPADSRGPSCLILCSNGGRPVHLVVVYPAKRHATQLQVSALAVLVTVYRPKQRSHEWTSDYRTRQPKP